MRERRASGAHVAPLSTTFILARASCMRFPRRLAPPPPTSLSLSAPSFHHPNGGPTIFSPSLPALSSSLYRASLLPPSPLVASPRRSPRGVLGSSRREPTAAPKRPPLLSNASAFVEFGIPFSAARAVRRRGNAAATRALVVLVPLCPSKIVWIRLPVLLSAGVFTEPRYSVNNRGVRRVFW